MHAQVRHIVTSEREDNWLELFPSPAPPDGYSEGARQKLKDSLEERSEAEQIAVWVAEEYKKRRKADHLAEEGYLAQQILMARYANASPQMQELAASNQPEITSLSTLCLAILNMEAKGGRDSAILPKLHRECLSQLQKTGVIEEGSETAHLKHVEDMIDEAVAASGLRKEERDMVKFYLYEVLITHEVHRKYDTEEKLSSFINYLIEGIKEKISK